MKYVDIGTGDVVIFIHGLGQRYDKAWEPQYTLADNYRLIIPALRGHLGNETDGEISLRSSARDIIQLIDDLEIESAYIGGLSLGGLVAQEIHRQAPEKVKGLILTNTTSYIPPFFGYRALAKARGDIRDGTLLDAIAQRGLRNRKYAEEVKAAFSIEDRYLDVSKAAIGINYFPYLVDIKVPTLLIGSGYDIVTPSLNVYLMRPYIRNCESIIFPNAGHLSNFDVREEFNQAVDQFLRRNK